MDFSTHFIDYTQTGYFNQLVTDYISGNDSLQSFYKYPVSIEGIKVAIEDRKRFNTDRKLLVTELQRQYNSILTSKKVDTNIQSLLNENTFTICTAHQPNIFTGHLYFIYKILHTIKLSESLSAHFPEYNFVPVYYMGSEDADVEELGQVNINGEKYLWDTKQTGAVGRMKVDKALIILIEQIEGQLLIYPFGNEIISLIKSCYKTGVTIEQATFELVNALFAEYGLIILLPDNPALKKSFISIVEKELSETFSHKAVAETAASFPAKYKLQVNGRELNLFYLKEDSRERIVREHSIFKVQHSKVEFNAASIATELKQYPERFSPNVILRPVFQELVLPNIAFIGGGGEIAYWLELKKVFEAANVPYPMLIVRNSFMLITKEIEALIEKLNFDNVNLFKPEIQLLTELVKRDSTAKLSLEEEKQQLTELYEQLKSITGKVDITLQQHTEALQARALKKINALEKKMVSAEKKKFQAQQQQLHKIKLRLFPNDSLQERVDNLLPYYAKWGKDFIKAIYKNSLTLEQQFTILTES
jgi:bacillithiol biosynthesis cysteine-adding enzyme BshC